MKQWLVLFAKEWKESLRNFKWVWIPLVFILLGIMQPVSSYFLPDILKNFGGLQEGAVMEFPIPTGAQVLTETLGQFGQIGILVLVLSFMGTVASERNNGTSLMVLVKPVSHTSYLTAKWLHMCLLAGVSFILGFSLAYYYTYMLIEEVAISNTLLGAGVYLINLIFVMTLVLCLSSIVKSTGAVAFLTLGLTVTMSLVSSLAPDLMRWSPGVLVSHSSSLFATGQPGELFWLTISGTVGLIVLLVSIAVIVFKNKEKAIHTT